MVYIGESGTITQNGQIKDQSLRDRINNDQEGMKRQEFFDQKMVDENIDGLDIYWFVTMDQSNNDLPAYTKALIIQRYYEVHGRLPLWNKDY